MFDCTDHDLAPWHIISGEQKRWARVHVLETVLAELTKGITTFEQPDWGADGWA